MVVKSRKSRPATAAVVAVLVIAGCGDAAPTRAERGGVVVDACRDNGGVAAFDDESVICSDQTANDERAASAVEACREREGVTAFDDDIAICGDQSVQPVEGG
jgi:hypothetical protein